jgi:hypothetical protein
MEEMVVVRAVQSSGGLCAALRWEESLSRRVTEERVVR